MTTWIRLDGENLGFAAAHFASYDGDLESLHGHNYQVIVEVAGGLNEDSLVIDFGRIKRLVRDLCSEIDHKFLLQGGSSRVEFKVEGNHRTIKYGSRRYVMPEADVAELPIDNTTAERLAEWFAGRLAQALREDREPNLESIRVGIEEGPGQSGWFSMPLDGS